MRVRAQRPFIEAYDKQEGVPYEVPEFRPAQTAYDDADRRLEQVCNS